MNFRLATSGDIPQLIKLLSLLFGQEADFTPHAQRQRAGLEMALNDPNIGFILVAEDDAKSEISGMVNLLFTVSTALGARVAILKDMVVSPETRGQGIGSKLIEEAAKVCREKGIQRITLLTDGDNQAAHSFYQKHQFDKSQMVVFRRFLES